MDLIWNFKRNFDGNERYEPQETINADGFIGRAINRISGAWWWVCILEMWDPGVSDDFELLETELIKIQFYFGLFERKATVPHINT